MRDCLIRPLAALVLCCACVAAIAADAATVPAAEQPAAAPAPAVQPAPAAAAPAADAAMKTDAEFFSELGFKGVATASDVARALAIFVSEGKQSGADFTEARQFLTIRGVLPDGWLNKAGPDDLLTKGNLARLVVKALGVKGGLWMRLLGPVPRAALNECAYLEIMVSGCEWCNVSGGELVGVIDRADRFRLQEAGSGVPVLEGEPSGAESRSE
jgi:hypothetical protein